jgi:hypothetical protein
MVVEFPRMPEELRLATIAWLAFGQLMYGARIIFLRKYIHKKITVRTPRSFFSPATLTQRTPAHGNFSVPTTRHAGPLGDRCYIVLLLFRVGLSAIIRIQSRISS